MCRADDSSPAPSSKSPVWRSTTTATPTGSPDRPDDHRHHDGRAATTHAWRAETRGNRQGFTEEWAASPVRSLSCPPAVSPGRSRTCGSRPTRPNPFQPRHAVIPAQARPLAPPTGRGSAPWPAAARPSSVAWWARAEPAPWQVDVGREHQHEQRRSELEVACQQRQPDLTATSATERLAPSSSRTTSGRTPAARPPWCAGTRR